MLNKFLRKQAFDLYSTGWGGQGVTGQYYNSQLQRKYNKNKTEAERKAALDAVHNVQDSFLDDIGHLNNGVLRGVNDVAQPFLRFGDWFNNIGNKGINWFAGRPIMGTSNMAGAANRFVDWATSNSIGYNDKASDTGKLLEPTARVAYNLAASTAIPAKGFKVIGDSLTKAAPYVAKLPIANRVIPAAADAFTALGNKYKAAAAASLAAGALPVAVNATTPVPTDVRAATATKASPLWQAGQLGMYMLSAVNPATHVAGAYWNQDGPTAALKNFGQALGYNIGNTHAASMLNSTAGRQAAQQGVKEGIEFAKEDSTLTPEEIFAKGVNAAQQTLNYSSNPFVRSGYRLGVNSGWTVNKVGGLGARLYRPFGKGGLASKIGPALLAGYGEAAYNDPAVQQAVMQGAEQGMADAKISKETADRWLKNPDGSYRHPGEVVKEGYDKVSDKITPTDLDIRVGGKARELLQTRLPKTYTDHRTAFDIATNPRTIKLGRVAGQTWVQDAIDSYIQDQLSRNQVTVK